MTIFILNLIPPGGRNEPFHPVGASWRFQGAGHTSPQHWCYPSRGHQVTFCVPATIIVISDGVKSHLYIDFHTYTWLFKVFFSTTQHLFCQGLNAKVDNLGTVKYKIPILEISGQISVDTKITVLDAKKRHLLQILSKFSVESFVHPQTINNWDDLNLAGPYSIREEDHHGRGRRAIVSQNHVGLLNKGKVTLGDDPNTQSSLPFLSLPCFHLSSCTSGDGSTVRGQASWNVRLWNCRCGEYFSSSFDYFSFSFEHFF